MAGMIYGCWYPNPLAPDAHRPFAVEADRITVADLLRQTGLADGPAVRVMRQEEELTATTIVSAGDALAVMPVAADGDTARMLGMLTVMAVATYVTAGGAAFGGMFGAGSVSAALLGGTIAAAGGLAVNALIPASSLPGANFKYSSVSSSEEAVHAWNPANPADEGSPRSVLYGTRRISGQILARRVVQDGQVLFNWDGDYTGSDDNRTRVVAGQDQRLAFLIGLAGHAVDSVSDIRIDDRPLSQFSEAATSLRLGAWDQELPEYHFDAVTEVPEGRQLTDPVDLEDGEDGWIEGETQGDQVNALGIGFKFAQGLTRYTGGSHTKTSVTLRLEVRAYDAVDWTTAITQEQAITADTTQPYFVYFHMLASSVGRKLRYRAKVVRVNGAKEGDGWVDRRECWVEYRHEYTLEDFRYPGMSLLSGMVTATGEISGDIRNIDCLATRATVDVWDGAAWVQKPATNPAWACYDAHVNGWREHPSLCSYGAGVNPALMIYAEWEEWAAWCDTQGYTCNVYFDRLTTLDSVRQVLEALGRGEVVERGRKLGVHVHKPSAPVALFTLGNIVTGSFRLDYLASDEYVNTIEIAYDDPDADYRPRTLTVRDAAINPAVEEIRSTRITLTGCTSQAQAVKHAALHLNKNRYIRRTLNFDSGTDGWPLQHGDVIHFAHPAHGVGTGGRVVSGTVESVVLDREVFTPRADVRYFLLVRYADDTMEEREVLRRDGGSPVVDLLTPLSQVPNRDTVYSFGQEGHVTKAYQVVTSDFGEGTTSLACIEYRAEILDDSLPVPVYEQEAAFPAVAGLRAFESLEDAPLGPVSVVRLAWSGVAAEWNVQWRLATEDWNAPVATTKSSYAIAGLAAGTYRFRVSAGTESLEIGRVVSGSPAVAPAIDGLQYALSGQSLILRWFSVPGYRYRVTGPDVAVDVDGNRVVLPAPDAVGDHVYTVEAADGTGRTATAAVSISIVRPATPVITASIVASRCVLRWSDCAASLPLDRYEVDGVAVGLTRERDILIDWAGERVVSVVAVDMGGNASQPGTVNVEAATSPVGTDLRTTAKPYGVFLQYTLATALPDGGIVELWSAEANDRQTATRLTETVALEFLHGGLPLRATRYYWLRTRVNGLPGAWYPASATAGVRGDTSTDPADYLDVLAGSITGGQLDTELAQRIAKLDDIDAVLSLLPPLWDNAASYTTGALVSQGGYVYTALRDMAAPAPAVSDATAWEPQGSLSAWFGDIPSSLDVLNGRISAVTYALVAPVWDDGVWEPDTWVAKPEDIPPVDTRLRTARVDIDAQAGQIAQLVQDVDTTTGRVTSAEQRLAVTEQATGELAAEYMVKLDVDGSCAGFGLVNDGATSEAVFRVDAFRVVSPSMPQVAPFVVGTIGGQSLVGINGDLIVDGSIAARQLEASIISGEFLSADAQITLGAGGLLRMGEGAALLAGDGNLLINTQGTTSMIMGPDGAVDRYGNVAAGKNYMVLTDGDIQFFRHMDGAARQFRSLRRMTAGWATNGATVAIDGFWQSPPQVHLSPRNLKTYKNGSATVDQSLNMEVTTVSKQPGYENKYQFTANARLVIAAGQSDFAVGVSAAVGTDAGTATTSAYTTPPYCSAAILRYKVKAIKPAGTQNVYQRRQVTVRAYVGGVLKATATIQIGDSVEYVSGTINVSLTSGPSGQAVHLTAQAADAAGTFTLGNVVYDYTTTSGSASYGINTTAEVPFTPPAASSPGAGWTAYAATYAFVITSSQGADLGLWSGPSGTLTGPGTLNLSTAGTQYASGWVRGRVVSYTLPGPNYVYAGPAALASGSVVVQWRKPQGSTGSIYTEILFETASVTLTGANTLAEGTVNYIAFEEG